MMYNKEIEQQQRQFFPDRYTDITTSSFHRKYSERALPSLPLQSVSTVKSVSTVSSPTEEEYISVAANNNGSIYESLNEHTTDANM